jgi:hypothetical protein
MASHPRIPWFLTPEPSERQLSLTVSSLGFQHPLSNHHNISIQRRLLTPLLVDTKENVGLDLFSTSFRKAVGVGIKRKLPITENISDPLWFHYTRFTSIFLRKSSGKNSSPHKIRTAYKTTRPKSLCIVVCVFVATVTSFAESLSSNDMEIRIQTHRIFGEECMKYAVELGSGSMVQISTVKKISSGTQKLNRLVQRHKDSMMIL